MLFCSAAGMTRGESPEERALPKKGGDALSPRPSEEAVWGREDAGVARERDEAKLVTERPLPLRAIGFGRSLSGLEAPNFPE